MGKFLVVRRTIITESIEVEAKSKISAKIKAEQIPLDQWPDKWNTLELLAQRLDRLPCGCHCEGGCVGPYDACGDPCEKHIPF